MSFPYPIAGAIPLPDGVSYADFYPLWDFPDVHTTEFTAVYPPYRSDFFVDQTHFLRIFQAFFLGGAIEPHWLSWSEFGNTTPPQTLEETLDRCDITLNPNRTGARPIYTAPHTWLSFITNQKPGVFSAVSTSYEYSYFIRNFPERIPELWRNAILNAQNPPSTPTDSEITIYSYQNYFENIDVEKVYTNNLSYFKFSWKITRWTRSSYSIEIPYVESPRIGGIIPILGALLGLGGCMLTIASPMTRKPRIQ